MAQSQKVSQKVIVITGASQGIGAALVEGFRAQGHRVVANSRSLKPSTDPDILSIAGDIADPAVADQLVARALERFGRIDTLVNNAGISLTTPSLDLADSDWDAVIDTNLKGAWLASREAAQRWVKQKRPGNIINIASILGQRVTSQTLPYAVSKAGLIQMTKALSLEWARHNIRVNALAPGYIRTALNDEFFSTEAGAALVKRIPQRRLGQLPDLDGPLLLLASAASSYMTGTVLTVDGGHLNSSL